VVPGCMLRVLSGLIEVRVIVVHSGQDVVPILASCASHRIRLHNRHQPAIHDRQGSARSHPRTLDQVSAHLMYFLELLSAPPKSQRTRHPTSSDYVSFGLAL
jgi:hypothetical protein